MLFRSGPRFPDIDPGDGSGIYATHYAFWPRNTAKKHVQGGNAYGMVVLKTSVPKRVAAGAEVAAWSARSDVQVKIADASGHPPPNSVAARDDNLPRRIKDNAILKAINDADKNIYLTPNYPSWTEGTNLITASLQRVLKGELLPRDALAEIQVRMQALVDQDLRNG